MGRDARRVGIKGNSERETELELGMGCCTSNSGKDRDLTLCEGKCPLGLNCGYRRHSAGRRILGNIE